MSDQYQKYLDGALKEMGLTLEEIQSMSSSEFRAYVERKTGKKVKFVSEPSIGRGVLHDFVTSEEVDERVRFWLREK